MRLALIFTATLLAGDPSPAVKRYLDELARPFTIAERKAWAAEKAEKLRELDRRIARVTPDSTTPADRAKKMREAVQRLKDERKALAAQRTPTREIQLEWGRMKEGDVGQVVHKVIQIKVERVIDDDEVVLLFAYRYRDGRAKLSARHLVYLEGLPTKGLTTGTVFEKPTVAEVIGTWTYGAETIPHLKFVDLSRHRQPTKK